MTRCTTACCWAVETPTTGVKTVKGLTRPCADPVESKRRRSGGHRQVGIGLALKPTFSERGEAWLSRLVGDQEIAGSNPAVLIDLPGKVTVRVRLVPSHALVVQWQRRRFRKAETWVRLPPGALDAVAL